MIQLLKGDCLEVMKQIAFSVKEEHFSTIEIWADDKAPDPLVVGVTCLYYTYNEDGKRTENFTSKELLMILKTVYAKYEETKDSALLPTINKLRELVRYKEREETK